MELTLREALRIGPLSAATVVAGHQGLDKVIRSVTMMEAPDILDWAHPGDFLVTTSYPLLDRTIPEQDFIPKLYEKGIIGLAAKLHAFLKEYPPAMIEAANRLGFPLIDIPTTHSLMELIQPLTNEILERRTTELIQSQAIHTQFLNLVLHGGGFNEIAQAISQLVKHPVFIVDRISKIIGRGFVIGYPNVYDDFINTERDDELFLSDNYVPQVMETWQAREIRKVIIRNNQFEFVHMICPIKVGTLQLGQVIVWGNLDLAKSLMVFDAVEYGAMVAALKLMEQRSISQVEERFRKEILEGLLSEQANLRKRAFNQLCDLGFTPLAPFVIILVNPDHPEDQILGRDEQNNFNESLYLAKRHIRLLNKNAIFFDQATHLVVCFPTNFATEVDQKKLCIELEKVAEVIKANNNPFTVSMGVSREVNSFDNFHRAYDYARQSLHIGRILRKNAYATVTNYEDLGIMRIMASSLDSEILEEFRRDSIGKLLQYDKENGTELYKTLKVYIEQGANSAHAAQALYIHYNTLRYRIDCIEAILGYSLKEPQKRISIEVAILLDPFFPGSPTDEKA